MKLYISIPITGHDYETQKEKALKLKAELFDGKTDAITPFDIVADPKTDYATAMGMCVQELLKCDAIYLCDGWEESKGCKAELSLANIYGLNVLSQSPLVLAKGGPETYSQFCKECSDLFSEWRGVVDRHGDFFNVGSKMATALALMPNKYFKQFKRNMEEQTPYGVSYIAEQPKEDNPNVARFKRVLDRMAETYAKKNADYGDSFTDGCSRLGYQYALGRIYDKYCRCENLLLNGNRKVKDETIQDTLIDISVYCILLKMYIDNLEMT